MPKLRDPQGHKQEFTQKQIDDDSLGICSRCGYPWAAQDIVQTSAPPMAPEAPDGDDDESRRRGRKV